MKKIIFLGLSCLILQTLTPVNAQHKKALRDSATVIIFSGNTKPKAKKTGESNIVKISPLGLFSGTFPITFERRITDYFSLQASAGLTLRNYARTLFMKKYDNESVGTVKFTYPWGTDSYDDVSESLYSFNYRKAKLGYMVSLQPRIYFESEGLEGPFLGLSFDHYRYNFDIPSVKFDALGNPTQDGPTVKEFENITDFMVNFGTQTLYNRISLEYAFALGLRNVSGSKYAARYNYSTYEAEEGMATYKQTLFNFNIAFRVGYHF
jgi:hypothetical protein